METINIINNLDQKIIMENMLMTNQHKLLNLIKKIFESEYLEINKMSLDDIIKHINLQKFINFELFIDLINLESEFQINRSKTNSLKYLIETKSLNLLEFLLDLELNFVPNLNEEKSDIKQYGLIKWIRKEENIFGLIFKNLYKFDNIIDKLICLIMKNESYLNSFKTTSFNKKSNAFYAISKCSEVIIIKLLEMELIEIDWFDDYFNGLIHWACKRNFVNLFNWIIENDPNAILNINKFNRGNRTPIHLACMKNSTDLIKILIDKKVNLKFVDLNGKYALNYAIKYTDLDMVKLLINNYIDLISNDVDFNLKIFYEIIEYQKESLIKYVMDEKLVNIEKTNLIWTLLLCGNKKYYSTMYSYGIKKITSIFNNFMDNMVNSYDGHNMKYVFDDEYDKDN